MKKILLFLSVLLTYSSSFAQIDVTATSGTPFASYATLKDAFDALNSGIQTGTITIAISGNTTETASAVLNASGTGGANYTSITISPTGGVLRTISGSLASALVDLNGADNVTIDGLNTGGNALTFDNQNTGIAGTTTIRFIGDATNNTINNCTLLGASTSASTGTVFFSTGLATGNSNNMINNCTVSGSGATFATNGIFSSGTVNFNNSNNTIQNCKIENTFSGTLASVGILVATNNSTWTIHNNKFYQTASRTYTTANTHRAIQVTTGNGYTITNNVIGYASNTATGIYTMLGTIATRFIAIDLAVGTTVATSVQNNTVSSISLNTSSGAATANGVLCGLNITAGNVNVGNITPNTFGGASPTLNSLSVISTSTQGSVVGINSSSTGAILIQGNIFGGFSSGNTAAIGGGVFGINVSGAAASMTITNNIIGNTTADNMRAGISGTTTTGSSIAVGINVTSAAVVLNVTGNTVQNFSSFQTTGTGYARGIVQTVAGTGAVFNGNTVRELKTGSALTVYTSGLVSVAGIYVAAGTNPSINGNTIYNLSNINTGTGNYTVAGISIAACTNMSVSKNVVYGLSNAGTGTTATAPPVICGVLLRSGTTATNIFNNMISLGNGITTNTTIIGIFSNHGSTPNPTVNVYYNNVNIEGTAAAGALASFGYVRGDLTLTARTPTVDIRNNIFTNTRTGGTGKHYAISNNYGATTASATGWAANASNFNVLNANATTIAYWTTDQTFATWKTISSSDANSFSGVAVNYANSAVGDLHLNMGMTPTQLESGGTTIATYTTDFDGDTRNATTPDVGADEFTGVSLDLVGPAISYIALANTSITFNRAFANVTITDATGVNGTAGTRPRVYFRRSTDANAYNDNTSGTDGWKYVEASGATSPFSFTLDYSLLNGGTGVTTGQTVQYFVVAQDIAAPTVGVSPAVTFASTPATVDLAGAQFPVTGTPSSYTIVVPFAGSYDVGATAPTYTTLKSFFDAVNANVLNGDITVNIIDNTIETATAQLNALAEEGIGGYSVTIQPSGGGARLITGNLSTAAIIKTVGVNKFTINGLNSGGNALTVSNTNATAPLAIHIASSGTTVVSNINISNITTATGLNTGTTVSSMGVSISDQASGGVTAGYFNNVTIQNNTFTKSHYGALVSGGTTGVNNALNVNILNNNLTSSGVDAIGYCGIALQGVNGATIANNTIGNFEGTAGVDDRGIWLAAGSKNVVVEKNSIISLKYIGTGGYGTYGIYVTTGETNSGNILRNNVIADLSGDGWTHLTVLGDNTHGIYATSTQTGIKIYNNSINLSGNTLNQTDALTTGICLGTGSTADIRNNIIVNNSGLLAATGYGSTAIYLQTSASQLENAGYNNLFDNATGSGVKLVGKIGTTDYATLAAWKAAVALEVNSISADPLFTALTDLTPSSYGFAGMPISGITNDFIGTTRNTMYPSLGAYEASLIYGSWKMASADAVWETNTNWVGDLGPGTTVIIPSGASFMPTLSTNAALSRLYNNGTLTINGANTISVSGDLSNTGTITGTDAGLIFNGTTAQTAALTGNINVKDVTLNNALGATLNGLGFLNVTGTATVSAGALAAGGRLVLKSTMSGTARIAAGTGLYITGNVTTETYIPGGRRAYRFLGHPFSTTLSMSSLLDDIYVTGDGTIAGTGGATPGTDLDATGTNAASSYWFDNTTNGWKAFMTAADASWTQYAGTRVLVRGDRTQAVALTGVAYTPNEVTLDVTGEVNTGNVNINVPTANNYHLVSNPYPSPTDIGTVIQSASNLGTLYWVWNANAGSKGQYVNRLIADGAYNLAMNGAFFVQPTVSSSLAFTEANKTATATQALYRTASTRPAGYLELAVKYNNEVADNIYVRDVATASTTKDAEDGGKLINPDINIYTLSTNNDKLTLDSRPIASTTVIPLALTSNVQNNFSIELIDNGFNNGLPVVLKDKFLNVEHTLTASNPYSFAVTADAASQGENRFELVFRNSSALPTNFVSVSAVQQGNAIAVNFTTANEQNMSNYEVEESANGNSFTKGTSIKANNTTTANYNWLDATINNGNNYYRIKAIEKNGIVKYSQVVNVRTGTKGAEFAVYPNPVKGGTINVQLMNVEQGQYSIKIVNKLGQEIAARTITHNGGSATQSINIGNVASGTYNMVISNGTTSVTKTVIVE